MIVNRERYVIVNVWTSSENAALHGANVGHVSLTTPENYISLWPNSSRQQSYSTKFFQGTKRKVKTYFGARDPGFKMDYEQDCILETRSENGEYTLCLMSKNTEVRRNHLYVALMDDGSLQYTVIDPSGKKKRDVIGCDMLSKMHASLTAPLAVEQLEPFLSDILEITARKGHTKEILCRLIFSRSDLLAGETIVLLDTETGTHTIWEDEIPAFSEEKNLFLAFKLVQASFRMALYSLDVQEINNQFERLKEGVTGWSLVGSNMLTRTLFTEKNTENCSSLAYRCLNSGGLSRELKSKLSSQTSSVITPDDLLRRIVAFKERELIEYPDTVHWSVGNIQESQLEDVKKAYEAVGLHANAEDDFFPGIIPFGVNCKMS